MKFCKRYEEYMKGRDQELPAVGLKKLKKILKRCSREVKSKREKQGSADSIGDDLAADGKCPNQCPVCDGTFFPALVEEMSAVVGCFHKRAQKLLELNLASGFMKYVILFRRKMLGDHEALMQEGKDLVTYAIINAVAVRKILKKYDKIHYLKQGRAFKSEAHSLRIEILQSPWLCELMAFYINVKQIDASRGHMAGFLGDCHLKLDDDKPILSCCLLDSMSLDISLTCSICLETVFDPISLTCGHIFCYMCCCLAASVTIIDGLKAASPKERCPLCRKKGVYENYLHLNELKVLLSRCCPEYWEERLQFERVQRLQQAKEHWECQCRTIMGI
ncbi:hypothetical protein HPP92_000383 [Vanilla planifolia]|uniref:RING-type E3 ubiquitin transferase n=1 Tax=Vanilla planifolia TaxID=51239 RepID=A0A835S5K1_VANPL|nr:hypothetical protein HPP92_000410 [Vanilla planifolia]KAG0500311.1 hypothetical protein HPP92_000383 [Vanilla planifolia]